MGNDRGRATLPGGHEPGRSASGPRSQRPRDGEGLERTTDADSPAPITVPQILPTIEGNVDYQEFRVQLLRIDQRLPRSRVENQLIRTDLESRPR